VADSAELSYYRDRLDELTGQIIKSDSIVSRSKRELGQRRKALALLSELQRTVRADMPEAEVARLALSSAATALKMDRTVLLRTEDGAHFTAAHTLGYPPAEDPALAGLSLVLPQFASESASRLVTAATPRDDATSALSAALRLPFFVAAPVFAGKRCAGLIVSGRLREAKPFFPPLDDGDLSTWQATAGFLGSAILNADLFARVKAMADSFSRFVPREFLDLLGRDDLLHISIGDQTHLELSILFSDIRGFTTLSEKLSPEETFAFVNAYLAFAAPVIRRNGGFIDKYIGDAIMALFPRSPEDAVRAGIELQTAADAFNRNPPLRLPGTVAVGVGIHTGNVMLGTTGYQNGPEARLDCTVIADAVNLASRLEGLTKYYGSRLILSADTLSKIPYPPAHRLVDRVRVKGKSDPVLIYDVYAADDPETRALKHGTRHDFAAALSAYTTGDLAAANVLLAAVLERHPTDLAALLLATRIQHFQSEGLPENWNGVVSLDTK
jgi:class 3 adenylate cyclase